MMLSEIIAALWGCINPTYMNIERIKTFDLDDMQRHRCTFRSYLHPNENLAIASLQATWLRNVQSNSNAKSEAIRKTRNAQPTYVGEYQTVDLFSPYPVDLTNMKSKWCQPMQRPMTDPLLRTQYTYI